jgi:cytoskeletal protein CcmA (bactofilin family)
MVEANAIKSRVMRIAEGGAFKGSAEVDVAEIHGDFDGDLIALQKLVIYKTGKVSGKVRYGKVVIEEDGQVQGDIQPCVSTSASSAASPRSLMVAKL